MELLKNDLQDALGGASDINLQLASTSTNSDRSVIDPTVLVALVGAVGAGLPTLIEALFGLLTSKEKIVLTGKSGRSIEVPADTPSDRLREFIGLARTLDVEEITLSKS
jgi:ABC-type branched-subunit amino acid transport system ATPase component